MERGFGSMSIDTKFSNLRKFIGHVPFFSNILFLNGGLRYKNSTAALFLTLTETTLGFKHDEPMLSS